MNQDNCMYQNPDFRSIIAIQVLSVINKRWFKLRVSYLLTHSQVHSAFNYFDS